MKIAVLGYAGSGKTYLSDYIAEKKNIPVLHIDDIKWDKEWKPIDNALVLPIVKDFLLQECWIIDGYYMDLLMDARLASADQIILLQLPRLTCFVSALKRTKSRKQQGYINDMNAWFIRFLLFGCRDKERCDFYSQIASRYQDKTVILLSRRQVNVFLKQFKT